MTKVVVAASSFDFAAVDRKLMTKKKIEPRCWCYWDQFEIMIRNCSLFLHSDSARLDWATALVCVPAWTPTAWPAIACSFLRAKGLHRRTTSTRHPPPNHLSLSIKESGNHATFYLFISLILFRIFRIFLKFFLHLFLIFFLRLYLIFCLHFLYLSPQVHFINVMFAIAIAIYCYLHFHHLFCCYFRSSYLLFLLFYSLLKVL